MTEQIRSAAAQKIRDEIMASSTQQTAALLTFIETDDVFADDVQELVEELATPEELADALGDYVATVTAATLTDNGTTDTLAARIIRNWSEDVDFVIIARVLLADR